jgi:hypothetical protein
LRSAILTVAYVRQRPKVSQCPDGKITDALCSTLACTTANDALVNTVGTCRRDLENFPSPRWEHRSRACLHSRLHKLRLTLRSTTDCTCHKDLNFSHRPDGKMAYVLSRLLLARLRTLRGQLQGVRATETLKTSHRINGRLTLCLLFAGWWCRCLGRHSGHLIVHHQWEYSKLCARSCSKVPIAPMGKLLTCLSRLTLGQL